MSINKKSLSMFIIFISLYVVFHIYINNTFYSVFNGFSLYENLDIIYKTVLKMYYLVIYFGVTHSLLYVYDVENYNSNKDLLDKIIILTLILSESGFYFNLLKTLIY